MLNNDIAKRESTPIDRLKAALSSESVQEQFQNALKENSALFVASLIDVVGTESRLQECKPADIIREALKAAVLQLPISKSLGFAFIVPYKAKPQFQIGYRGYIQLAMRSGQYRFLNADVVYDGELLSSDKLSGHLDLGGDALSEEIVGYFAYLETVNGFKKAVYWPKEKVIAHAKRHSQSFNNEGSAWKTSFDEMAIKTMIRNLLGKYGIMSVDMVSALTADAVDERTPEAQLEDAVDQALTEGEIVDIESGTGKEAVASQVQREF